MQKLWEVIFQVSLEATIVGGIILVVKSLLKNKLNAKWNYLIWGVLIIKLIVPFGPESDISIFNQIPKSVAPIEVSKEESNTGSLTGTESTLEENDNLAKEDNYENINSSAQQNDNNTYISESYKSPSILKTLNSYMPYIWIIGMVNILFVTLAIHTMLNFKLRRNNIPVSKEKQDILIKTKKMINTKQNIKVVINEYISTPALISIIKPKILLPSNMVNLSEKELEYIFLHELAHNKRKDILINYILLVIQSIHWFNPMIWYFVRCIREDIEFATDEKVLMILDDGEHKDYAMSILSVLEKVNNSLFYPRLVSMANDKKKIEKRLLKIKNMKFMKSKQLVFTAIGLVVILIIAPILLTTSVKDKYSKTESTVKIEEGLSSLQEDYLEVLKEYEKEKLLNEDELEKISDNTVVSLDGHIGAGMEAYSNYGAMRSFEVREDNEKISVAHSYNQDIREDLRTIHYVDDSTKGYINDMYVIYRPGGSNVPRGLNDSYKLETVIGSTSVENQMKLLDNINLGKEEGYNLYFEIAKIAQIGDTLSEDKLKDLQSRQTSYSRYNPIFIEEGNCLIAVMIDKNVVYGVELIDSKNNIRLYTLSGLGDRFQLISQDGDNVSETVIFKNTIDEQEELLLSLNKTISVANEDVDLNTYPKEDKVLEGNVVTDSNEPETEIFYADDKYKELEDIEEASYSSEINPKERSMKDSIEYVKEHTDKDIKEVSRVYEAEVGVNEVTYEANGKKYVVRYMHPYKMLDENSYSSEYDMEKTVGIWIYKEK